LATDVKNIANLINNEWGVYNDLNNYTILNYNNGMYTFTEPTWEPYANTLSTWSAVLGLCYKF